MGNDFKSFAKSGKSLKQEDIKRVKQNFSDGEIKNVENMTKQYENMSEGQMLAEIQRMARNSGGVSQSELSSFVNNIMPMLDNEQKAKLQIVLKNLK